MLIMESRNMEETSTENTKISDSGYSNTCSNSQSHTSRGSSLSRNSNQSASSGYRGNPSTFGPCTEALPKPMAKCKDKAYKKKKLKNDSNTTLLPCVEVSQILKPVGSVPPPNVPSVSPITVEQPCKSVLDKKAEEVAVVELVDVTDPGVHNDNNLPSITEAGLASKTCPIDESSSQFTEEYHVVTSMHNGLVLHATSSLHAFLGYPKDSWTGQLFIDFLDPKDRHIFTERITSEIAISRDFCQSGAEGRKTSIFCRLRRFNSNPCSLSNNSNGNQINVCDQYLPFRTSMVVQSFHGGKEVVPQSQVMLLVAFFQPLQSAYKVPEETIIPTVFTTRHTATCRLSYVDPDVVQYLGYLPQDMIDASLFDFYHPEDLPLIKDIYKTVINLDSSSYRSKPYRFIVQNGCYVVLETEWSSFVNPWTKKLEFIVGHHRVLKGPADPNIFQSCPDYRRNVLSNISEEVLKEARVIQKEIQALLIEGVQRKRSCAITDSDLLSKKKELTSFVENILQEIKSLAPIKDHMAIDDRSFSEHDSVMLGEISPHHEYFDSKSSTETPPSYGQLNYHDNIERFFNSNIGASVNNGPYGSDEENLHSSANSSDGPVKNNTIRPELQCTSSTNGSGNSGSAENLSSESNNQQSFGSRRETSNTMSNNSTSGGGNNNSNNNTNNNNNSGDSGRFKLPILTESLLIRHNEDMEKLMMQKHREQKKGNKRSKNEQKSKPTQQQQQQAAAMARCENGKGNKSGMRLKRNGSQNWEGAENNIKISKHDDPSIAQPYVGTNQMPTGAKFLAATGMDISANMIKTNLQKPPISVTIPAATNISHQCFTTTNACSQARLPMFPQMFPFCYLPVPQARENPTLTVAVPQEHPGPPNPLNPYCYVPVPYMTTAMSNIMYPPIIGTPAPATMMYRSFIVPEAMTTTTPINVISQPTCPPEATVSQTTATPNMFDLKRPASRATSDKAEPGSTMAMSESSKKIFSPSGVVSSCMSNEGGYCFSSSINKSCDSSSNTDQQNTASSFESHLSLNQSITHPKQMYHKSKSSRANQKRKAFGMVRKEPPWIEGVKLTPELIYQYQIGPKSLNEVLKDDLNFLRHSKQPSLVSDQLGQLFFDLDLEGYGSQLIVDETGTNSGSDSSSDGSQSPSRMGAW